jgi:hypothetical protein
MARPNERGLELSFKRYGGGRPGGRWFKIINGKPVYFGTSAIGVSDRKSYSAALSKYETDQKSRDEQASLRKQIAGLERLMGIVAEGNPVGDDLEFCMDVAGYSEAERQALRALSQGDHTALPAVAAIVMGARVVDGKGSVSALVKEFLAEQKRRHSHRKFVRQQQASGAKMKEARGEGLSTARLKAIEYWMERFNKTVTGVEWDGTERALAMILGEPCHGWTRPRS